MRERDRETETERQRERQRDRETEKRAERAYDTLKIIVTVQFHEGSKIFHFFSEKQ